MGTSGAYGGSAGWSGIASQTQEWLDGDATVEPSNGGGSEDFPPEVPPPIGALPEPVSIDPQPVSPPLTVLIGGLGRRLTNSGGGGGGSGGRNSGADGASSGTGTRGRSTARASSVGGRAAAGVYGLRTGNAGPLEDLRLSLDDLRNLPRYEQASRLLEAAMGPSGGIAESELRIANAELILWALNEEAEPAPIDLANRWVVEYVWQVWITEAGQVIRNHSANGYDSHRVEQEMRAALEATVAGNSLPEDRPLTTRDFEQAIDSALRSLERIGGKTS